MDKDSIKFGKKIKKARIKRRLSQKKLAALIGINQASISYWERGIKQPRLCNWKKLKRVLKGCIHRFLQMKKL